MPTSVAAASSLLCQVQGLQPGLARHHQSHSHVQLNSQLEQHYPTHHRVHIVKHDWIWMPQSAAACQMKLCMDHHPEPRHTMNPAHLEAFFRLVQLDARERAAGGERRLLRAAGPHVRLHAAWAPAGRAHHAGRARGSAALGAPCADTRFQLSVSSRVAVAASLDMHAAEFVHVWRVRVCSKPIDWVRSSGLPRRRPHLSGLWVHDLRQVRPCLGSHACELWQDAGAHQSRRPGRRRRASARGPSGRRPAPPAASASRAACRPAGLL
jgi:hypothetical protein